MRSLRHVQPTGGLPAVRPTATAEGLCGILGATMPVLADAPIVGLVRHMPFACRRHVPSTFWLAATEMAIPPAKGTAMHPAATRIFARSTACHGRRYTVTTMNMNMSIAMIIRMIILTATPMLIRTIMGIIIRHIHMPIIRLGR